MASPDSTTRPVDPLKRCKSTGKIKFTEEDARYEAKRYRKRYGSKMSAYLCHWEPPCGYWHIGHANAYKKRDKIKASTNLKRKRYRVKNGEGNHGRDYKSRKAI